MILGSIDPGQQTGLAIASVTEGVEVLMLEQVLLATMEHPLEVVQTIGRKCDQIVVEQRPMYASRDGLEPYEMINNALKIEQIKKGKSFKIFYYAPGMWKPLMKARSIYDGTDLGTWLPRTQHEKDALAMMVYHIRLKYKKEIRYV